MIHILRETHETPVAIRERLARAGGSNMFGEPNFRVVWGWNRLTWIGGLWEDRDANGAMTRRAAELRLEPKYLPTDRWHIERWMPPESYGSPSQWYAQTIEIENGISIPALGPFPHRGEYEHCFTLSGPRGEFIPLTVTAAEYVARAVSWAQRQARSHARAAVYRDCERREHEWSAQADAALGIHSTG
jgi:hypothetical protein